MEAAAPFAGLDPDTTGDAYPVPGTTARPIFASEGRAVAGKSKLEQALACASDAADWI
jgi:hypothetical protein